MNEHNWSIEIDFDGCFRDQPKEHFELRLQAGQPDRLYFRGREVTQPWRVWCDRALFSRDAHLFEMAVAQSQEGGPDA